jgi:hypothetical protein
MKERWRPRAHGHNCRELEGDWGVLLDFGRFPADGEKGFAETVAVDLFRLGLDRRETGP